MKLRLRIPWLASLLVVFVFGVHLPVQSGQAAEAVLYEFSANLRGQVIDVDTGLPVAGAQVSILELGIVTDTDDSGTFMWYRVGLLEARQMVTLQVQASGYGDWSAENVLLIHGETIWINPELSRGTTRLALPREGDLQSSGLATGTFGPHDWTSFLTFLAQSADLQMPETIRVGITGDWPCDPEAPYTVTTLDFKDYVKHVLPNEWYRSSSTEAFRAGAVAVKMYAWYWIYWGGKWRDPQADVIDSTCDQYYLPGVTFGPTDAAVDYTWDWILLRAGSLFQPFYKETQNCDIPFCMRQTDSQRLAEEGFTWDQILAYFYPDNLLAPRRLPPAGFSLYFSGFQDIGQVRVPVNDGSGTSSNLNAESGDFTVEWWLRAAPPAEGEEAVLCGAGGHWRGGRTIFEWANVRGVPPDQGLEWGVSLADGKVVFGVAGVGQDPASLTICSERFVADLRWHHIAVQRRAADGTLWLYVDGHLEAQAYGPAGVTSGSEGAVSEEAGAASLLIGSGSSDGNPTSNLFQGWLDEIRISNELRFTSDFVPPDAAYPVDSAAAGLFHLDEGIGSVLYNSAAAAEWANGSIAPDQRLEWVFSDLFVPFSYPVFLPLVQ